MSVVAFPHKKFRHHPAVNDLWWQLLGVFLRRRVKMFRTLCTVSVVFNTQLEAEQFQKLMSRCVRVNQEQSKL